METVQHHEQYEQQQYQQQQTVQHSFEEHQRVSFAEDTCEYNTTFGPQQALVTEIGNILNSVRKDKI